MEKKGLLPSQPLVNKYANYPLQSQETNGNGHSHSYGTRQNTSSAQTRTQTKSLPNPNSLWGPSNNRSRYARDEEEDSDYQEDDDDEAMDEDDGLQGGLGVLGINVHSQPLHMSSNGEGLLNGNSHQKKQQERKDDLGEEEFLLKPRPEALHNGSQCPSNKNNSISLRPFNTRNSRR